ncbi:HutD/Ves family protein [Solimonas marina]|uniref:HutD family protein n=1 Tax=Solimonas marina TaxID=2714601 RepID=A0A970B9E1_9GAMM|nr:HutD family protein [Solimonas marina]NKF22311.1 HutD family protein [Solimonas marina]
MKVQRAATHLRMPWKNGGGETLEIIRFPPEATLETLDWRISMARVAQDGPFSSFPDIDRTLCIIAGAGLELDFGADGGVQRLAHGDAPFAFPADRPLHARLIDDPVTDLNIMAHRSRYRHAVQHMTLAGHRTRTTQAKHLLVFCIGGEVELMLDDDAPIHVTTHDCAWTSDAHLHTVTLTNAGDDGAAIYWIELFSNPV